MKTNFEKIVEILRIEADAIERAAQKQDRKQTEKAIELLSCCNSKVIVTGVGKSGVIAQKIAQTLVSTGTVAVFVHPSDAIHGGLGVVTAGDVVIALSNSGETDEILLLLPTLKNRGIRIISIVGNMNSTLARQSDAALDASVDKEACPLNLAPTTSTTVALAIGDAVAMTLMEAKNLTAEDFAANHPAGRLGKRLTLKVKNLMHESPNISPDANWLEVVKAISKYALGAVNVVDENQKSDRHHNRRRSAPDNRKNSARKFFRTNRRTNDDRLADHRRARNARLRRSKTNGKPPVANLRFARYG